MYKLAYHGYLLTAILLSFLKGGRRQAGCLRTLDALCVGAAMSYGLKALTDEKRPDSSGDDSFPSSHTLEAFAAATTTSAFARQEAPFWYAGAASIGLSRILRNRHHMRDVLIGATFGVLLARWELRSRRGLLLRLMLPRST